MLYNYDPQKINFAPGYICSLHQKIIFWSVRKIWQKMYKYVLLHNMCVFVKFHEKTIFFVVYVKKEKHYLVIFYFEHWILYFFYSCHIINRFFMKRLGDRVSRRDVCEFYVSFFEILKYVWDAFQNKGSIRLHVPKHRSRWSRKINNTNKIRLWKQLF
jgi:hypothetical protein